VIDLQQYRPETFMHHSPVWLTAIMIGLLSIAPAKQLLGQRLVSFTARLSAARSTAARAAGKCLRTVPRRYGCPR
jgi:hypothetical protein